MAKLTAGFRMCQSIVLQVRTCDGGACQDVCCKTSTDELDHIYITIGLLQEWRKNNPGQRVSIQQLMELFLNGANVVSSCKMVDDSCFNVPVSR